MKPTDPDTITPGLDLGRAPSITAALEVIEYWQQPAPWAIESVSSVRRSVGRMNLHPN